MYNLKGLVDREAPLPAVGRAEIVRSGADVTIVATLLMVPRALEAAEALAAEGIDAEVIDLRWITPLDIDTIRESVSRTDRLVVVEEQVHLGGWGATLISLLAQEGLPENTMPRAVSLPNYPLAFSPPWKTRRCPAPRVLWRPCGPSCRSKPAPCKVSSQAGNMDTPALFRVRRRP